MSPMEDKTSENPDVKSTVEKVEESKSDATAEVLPSLSAMFPERMSQWRIDPTSDYRSRNVGAEGTGKTTDPVEGLKKALVKVAEIEGVDLEVIR